MKCTIKEAEILLRNGYVVGVPTDTVYGFAALEGYEAKIYHLKGRNRKKKLITMLANMDDLNVTNKLKKEFIKNWPGKVTYVFEEEQELKSYRIPKEANLLLLLKESNLKILTTSANKSGDEPCLSAEEFERRFPKVPLLEEPIKVIKGKQPSKIFVYNRGIKIRIR